MRVRFYSPTVLVVDDNDDLRSWVSVSLRKRGYNVLTASGGHEAISILRSNSGIEAVVSDMQMSQGDGAELIKALRAYCAHTPIFIMSANMEITEHEIKSLGGTGFFGKPFEIESLVDALTPLMQSDQSA